MGECHGQSVGLFTRTEGGTGLGLSIVHGIVERHGGRIHLDSRIGKGTSARLELPVTPPVSRKAVADA